MFKDWLNLLSALHNDEKGQGMTEYIIIIVLVAIAVIFVVTQFGGKIKEMFSGSTESLPTPDSSQQ